MSSMMPGYGGGDYTADGELIPEPGAQVVRLSDVEPERVSWLWPGYLPLGKVVVLDGDPGVGKSTVMLDLAARITTGSPMPDSAPPVKGAVLMLSAEDGMADTIRPRFDAAGGDPAEFVAITGINTCGDSGELIQRTVELPGDLRHIEPVVARNRVVLVIVDVLMAYLSGDVNSHRDQDVRRALYPLHMMAERTGCCVVVLRHFSKSGGPNAVYRGGGSIGIIGAARAGFMCGTDPDDDTGTARVFARTKGNLSEEPPALAYRLVPDELRGCARIQWDGVSGHTAAALLAEADCPEERTDRDEAAGWLINYLTGKNGEAPAGEVIRAAEKDGIQKHTLQRARKRAGVTTDKATFGGGWVWQLRP